MGNTSFTGEFRYTIDSKGRINIPARFRHVLPESSEDTFVVTRGMYRNIIAYSLDRWRQEEEEMLKLSPLNPMHRSFIRQTTRYATACKFDAQGRIALPQTLVDYARIQKEVVIIGMINEIEIWDPDLLNEKDDTEFQLDPEDFEALANEIRSQ